MVTTRHGLHANRRTTRQNNKQRSNRRKDKFTFKDYDEKLSSLGRRKKREKQPPNHTDVDKNNKTSTNVPSQPLRKVTRAALYNIGKVLNYEEQIEAPNKRDDDSTLLFPIPEIPDLPSILDNDDALDINSTNIDCQRNNTNGSIPMSSKQTMVETVQIQRSSSSTSLISTKDSIVNEDLTTDGNTSYKTINDLRNIIKYFGMSNHTTSNLP